MARWLRTDARPGTLAELAALAGDRARTLGAVREAVAALHPGAHEGASPRKKSVSWGRRPRKMTEGYAFAMPQRSHAGFFDGTALPGPEALREGTGKAPRRFRLRSIEAARRPAILHPLGTARDERRRAPNLQ